MVGGCQDLGPYPGGAVVEIYAINAEQLALLDQLEGYFAHAPHQGLYNRAIFPTQHGEVWCYLYTAAVDEQNQISSGKW
ncbi:gamma-glutamylcyclotransferase family protein [Vreelandella venusta]|uniref:gamma-glutamylcyclotransferase family protein n=1 Tax=Vreelandella venusta TaxID=44935 RepID=UPI0023E77A98|nr:gamma-glutamylcyclotransferase family protein [Halomonas venusta]